MPQHTFRPVAGGVRRIAARETEMRGPQLLAAQQSYNQRFADTIRAVDDHTQETAHQDYAMGLMQERKARIREEAADQSQAERAEDLAARQADFDQSVKAASAHQMTGDGGYWVNKSVPGKIGAAISLMLGGITQGRHGGPNPAATLIQREIDREVKAQEQNYHIDMDRVKAGQTAFGMAMNKYKNIDAARTFARASMLDTTKAQIAQQAARWKGTNAQNQAALAMADLEGQRMKQIAAGVQFRPEQTVRTGPTWMDKNGIRYNEKQMRGIAGEQRKVEGDMRLSDLKHQQAMELKGVDLKQKAAANRVELPSWGAKSGKGEVVSAPSKEEAMKLRKLVASSSRMEGIAKQVRDIKKDGVMWRVRGSEDWRRLEALQQQVNMVAKDTEELGVLAGPDMDIIHGMTGDVHNQVFGTKQLEDYKRAVKNSVTNRVRTYPGSSSSARAETPGSFVLGGRK